MASALADRFEALADAAPERTALVGHGERVSYRELDALGDRFAAVLADHGLGPGDVVALAGRNTIPWVVAFLGTLKHRAVPVNVNHRYVATELAEVLRDCDAAALVADREIAAECAAAIATTDEPRFVVVIGPDVGALGTRAVTYRHAMAAAVPLPQRPERSPDDITLLYTGGTTGRPKGVVWRQEDTYHLVTGGRGNQAAVAAARAGEQSAEVVLPAGPFVHSSAQWVLLGALLAGRTVVLLDRFNAEAVWELCDREHVDVLAITGDAMARPLLDALTDLGGTPPRLRMLSSSGGALSPTVKQSLADALPQTTVVDALGATETGLLGMSGSSEPAPGGVLRVRGTADTIVVDEHGQPVPRGTEGLLAKSGYIPLRYHNDPEKSARTFVTHAGVRFAIAGDVGRVEVDGSITVLGRQSACINTGGEKVFPSEVEAVVARHPAVDECLVVGVPDDRWGQLVCALVVARGGRTVTLDELQRHARSELAGYKIPRLLHLVDHIERLPSGKPDYRWADAITRGAG